MLGIPAWIYPYFQKIVLLRKKVNPIEAAWISKKVKLYLCLTKHYAMKAYWGVNV
jgi:hypothetical protein